MRKMHKEQAESFIALIASAHDEIKSAMEKKNIPLALRLLNDCQEGAIALGDMIEKTAGEDSAKIITLLEEYCEFLYQIHEQLTSEKPADGQSVNRKSIGKVLHRYLINIKNSIKQIKVHREAVFLPYKASMWDSLESVWRAAEEDPDCEAYVIPIPYYDRNPDGSLGEIHYEINQYPADVPVMRYDDYDFENRMPDMIFIHNPYDEYNYVTTVHPFFYSKNLKQFTEKLIYIPYFVLNEINVDDEQAVADMSSFCLLEGVMHAHQVIVQSENMRQVYIKALTKAMGEKTRGYWEKKILGLGSPKVDKVLDTRKEGLEIPEEWMRLIRRPDGCWKKIIFYNTSVTALLRYSDRMIAKIRDVFRIFYENREEVTLLWRPHPLIEATIKSMRPELWEEYRKLVEEYCAQGWGIYDDSADLDRAIVLSDAYYGDWSSVVQLYQETGKRVLCQNAEILSIQDGSFSIADIVRYNDKLYILTRDTFSLYEYDILTEKAKWCGFVKTQADQIFICMTVCEGKIYIAPYEANIVSVYDIEKGEFENIALRQPEGKRKNKYYHLCFSYQHKVFFLGGLHSTMLSIDASEGTVCEITDWMEEFERTTGREAAVMTRADRCIVGDCFWVALLGNNVLLQYNMATDDYHFFYVGGEQIQYTTVNHDGKYFWLSGNRKAIVKWEKETDTVKEIRHLPEGFEAVGMEDEELFFRCYLWHNNFYFAPCSSNMLIKLESKTGKLSCVFTERDKNLSCCTLSEISDDVLYMELMDERGVRKGSYSINRRNECFHYSISADRIDEINSEMESRFVLENHPECLKLLLAKRRTAGNPNDATSCMGKRIYRAVLEKQYKENQNM